MTIDDEFSDEKLQYVTNGAAPKNQHDHLVKLINMKFLQVKKYSLVIRDKNRTS